MMKEINARGKAHDRIIVGISGASGAVYGIRMLETLKQLGIETHLIVSESAMMTMKLETAIELRELKSLATVVHSNRNVAACVSSGSFMTSGMVIAPCSIRTMSDIAYGSTSNLLTRAADVVLKERRRLVLMVRETPLHLGHLRTMTLLAEIGAIIMPPVPAFYIRPKTIDDLVDHTVGRALDALGIETALAKRWRGGRVESEEDQFD
jgi:4-hydroxy-3-polyprenylbenzoate decarboxylase